MTSNDLAGILDREQARADRLATTLDSIGDGVIATDGEGRIERMNPVAERLTGWPLAEALGKPSEEVLRLLDGKTRRAIQDPFAHALRARGPVALPKGTLVLRRDGAELPISDTCAPVKSLDGRITGAVIVFRDQSAEAEAEAALARRRQEQGLRDQVASLEALAARAAHEINNPLCYVTANLHAVLDELRELGGEGTAPRMRALESTLAEALDGATRIAAVVRGLHPPPIARIAPRAPLKILVVDDELAIGHAIRRVLRDHEVECVTSGRAALERLALGNVFDLILSDLMMPEMSGMILYRRILQFDPASAQRMIFITGGVSSREAATFLSQVGNTMLEKPFSPDHLREAIQAVMSGG